MELMNVLALPDGVYLLTRCKCGVFIKHKQTVFRVTCPECNCSTTMASIQKENQH